MLVSAIKVVCHLQCIDKRWSFVPRWCLFSVQPKAEKPAEIKKQTQLISGAQLDTTKKSEEQSNNVAEVLDVAQSNKELPSKVATEGRWLLGYLSWEKWDSLWNGLQPEMISLMCVMLRNNHCSRFFHSHASGKGKRWSHEPVFPRETFSDSMTGKKVLGHI